MGGLALLWGQQSKALITELQHLALQITQVVWSLQAQAAPRPPQPWATLLTSQAHTFPRFSPPTFPRKAQSPHPSFSADSVQPSNLRALFKFAGLSQAPAAPNTLVELSCARKAKKQGGPHS